MFSKVKALEFFGDYYDYGRGVKHIPKHNAYVPAPTILPIPKFYHYTEDDYIGKDYMYRTVMDDGNEFQSVANQPSTMKPDGFKPMLPKW